MAVDETDKVKEIIDAWKNKKKIEADVMTPILNNILSKCNIQAILISKEIGLPPPVQLPKVQIKNN